MFVVCIYMWNLGYKIVLRKEDKLFGQLSLRTDHLNSYRFNMRIWQVGNSVLVPGADYALSSIHNIKEAIPEIWTNEEEKQLGQVVQSTAVENVAIA